MPIPHWVARANRGGLNRVLARVAWWAPGFGLLIHRGRKSGREFRTPLIVFRRDGGYLIALTYGPDTDWVKNVLAADGCRLITRRRMVELTAPRLLHDPSRSRMPPVVRQLLGGLGVTDFLMLDLTTRSRTGDQIGDNNAQ